FGAGLEGRAGQGPPGMDRIDEEKGAADTSVGTAHEAAHVVQQRTSQSPAEGADYNSSRSNKTHSVSDPRGGGGSAGGTRAQDYNSSRSNTTSLRSENEEGFGGDLAKDYNSSRSNTSSAMDVTSDPSGGGGGGSGGGDRAQDYNSSRSNNESARDGGGGDANLSKADAKRATKFGDAEAHELLEARKSENETSQ
ncbi:MAG: hypothetical protein GWN18_05470, partial [Thermoplasmata archaeon]|nr:hypothetical protein [Thermoplasmata archaeon]NIS19085.1 hypothetical protein [Thermoplasmata archaeon]NIT76147.1 hypothetical protein [Thermoplasmata archaeon]NIU48232.1 hypothetical protein [Thermoplasmata archaeon]NIW82023.1 hypothetical protein [Thermoplasmata archaeon]